MLTVGMQKCADVGCLGMVLAAVVFLVLLTLTMRARSCCGVSVVQIVV